MKVADLLNARESVQKLYSAQVDGKTALRIRRAVRKMQEPLQDYEEALKAYVESEGIGDGSTFADLTTQQQKHWNEMLMAEVDVTWDAPLNESTIDTVELSAAELDVLIVAGLISEEQTDGTD